ncbi:MAG: hypothetical protein KKC68_03280 [Candidatus Thermoplasmatota archaeon]|nr:hypothetical protein [Candidatus Thermoplasmatota archaeon]MBU1940775.1 hypothetical protein [Candidatus Thermoplasmatota archaeon]
MQQKWYVLQFIIGLSLAVLAVAGMFHGTLFGENTTGSAIVLGISGILLIATSLIGILKKQ